MLHKAQVSHGVWEKAVEIICSASGFMKVVMENDRFGDFFGIESTVSMIGNKKLKVLKVAKQASDRICSISDIWPI